MEAGSHHPPAAAGHPSLPLRRRACAAAATPAPTHTECSSAGCTPAATARRCAASSAAVACLLPPAIAPVPAPANTLPYHCRQWPPHLSLPVRAAFPRPRSWRVAWPTCAAPLRPMRRLQMCTDGPSCRRRVCFFAHYEHELRWVPVWPPFNLVWLLSFRVVLPAALARLCRGQLPATWFRHGARPCCATCHCACPPLTPCAAFPVPAPLLQARRGVPSPAQPAAACRPGGRCASQARRPYLTWPRPPPIHAFAAAACAQPKSGCPLQSTCCPTRPWPLAEARALQQQQLAPALSGILGAGSVPSGLASSGPSANLEPLMSVQVRVV